MANAFVSYAHQDSQFVRELTIEVEQRGHHLWHFERDSLPAEVYLEEISKAIEACDLIILIASRASLDSHQVTREVEQGHQRNKRFLPVHYGVTSDEIRDLQPTWSAALGATNYLKWEPGRERGLFGDIVRVLVAMSPAPVKISKPAQWAADATRIQIPNLDKVLFQTPGIREFLEDDHQFFISANKGVGKTLLLKSKRAALMEEHGGGRYSPRAEVLFIPENRPYLDTMSGEWPSLDRDHVELMSTLRPCRRLWSFAIRASILSHFPEAFEQLNTELFQQITKRSLETFIRPRTAATVVFKDLITTHTVKSLNRLLDKLETNLEYAFRGIHSGVFMFIDRVQQGVSNLSEKAWIYVQAGLIEAAWDVMDSNNHVKIYASIREEAYANYGSDSKINLYSATLNLRYSLEELHQMLDSLVRLYEAAPSFHQFVGTPTIGNLRCKVEEESFRYLHRHTVGRPRDLVIICSEISKCRSYISEDSVRDTVNDVGAHTILPLVFDENAVFLDGLRRPEDRNRFFGLLPQNILTRAEVERICCEFNGLDREEYETVSRGDVQMWHPFCELYNCGLIGTVLESAVKDATVQEFKQPHDVKSQCESCLPPADYYLLHPSLQPMIHKQRPGSACHVFRYITVGHRYPWRSYFSELVDLQAALLTVADKQVERTVMLLVESRLAQTNHFDIPVVADAPDLDEVQAILEERNLDDVWLQLDRFGEAVGAIVTEGNPVT